ncbi:MAG: mandelate racemase [Phycisphaerae bacterium]|nr:mandelate racemase [Phycisphaerae bacterium]NIP55042.1 mandelate racemase [Phycisphaerae bacterium]NIS53752.1 mandelate racemase [Phycisphaerae bacterium]NIU11330.1 mandelate racemase [Phycisphaerae bacterium]NIU57460.1 mandelate racemase [Phycisphaerae bacterium]
MINRREMMIAGGVAAAAGLFRQSSVLSASLRTKSRTGKLVISNVRTLQVVSSENKNKRAIYVEITTEDGPTGLYGPINKEQAFVIHSKFRSLLIGRDALAGQALWDKMRRRDRHARSSLFMMAISAVDNALWDIRGKHFGVPVYRLLGGPTRDRIRAYASMLGYSVEPDKAGKIAREYFDRGFTAQKWFFKYNPTHGGQGCKKNLQLVRALRKALGDEAELMFDCLWSWDVPYAISMAREILPYRPTWLEEPLHPEQLEGYKRIKRDTGIQLAAGEHFYTRWNVKQFLDAGVLDFVQADPEWCGGITELVKICALAEAYEVKVVPHGHHILAAAHVVAAQPPSVCPMVEYLFHSHLDRMQYFHRKVLRPEKGWLQLPTQPGLGLELDEDKIAEKRELKWD